MAISPRRSLQLMLDLEFGFAVLEMVAPSSILSWVTLVQSNTVSWQSRYHTLSGCEKCRLMTKKPAWDNLAKAATQIRTGDDLVFSIFFRLRVLRNTLRADLAATRDGAVRRNDSPCI